LEVPDAPQILQQAHHPRGDQDGLFELQPARTVPPLGLSGRRTREARRPGFARRRLNAASTSTAFRSPFEAIYAIRSGFFKTDVLLEDGREQVTGFQMAGELLGLDGISTEHHSCNAVALEDSESAPSPSRGWKSCRARSRRCSITSTR
jgi:hypothetical protein